MKGQSDKNRRLKRNKSTSRSFLFLPGVQLGLRPSATESKYILFACFLQRDAWPGKIRQHFLSCFVTSWSRNVISNQTSFPLSAAPTGATARTGRSRRQTGRCKIFMTLASESVSRMISFFPMVLIGATAWTGRWRRETVRETQGV